MIMVITGKRLTGVPHRLIVDDVWEDYFIPAGSTVLSNIW